MSANQTAENYCPILREHVTECYPECHKLIRGRCTYDQGLVCELEDIRLRRDSGRFTGKKK